MTSAIDLGILLGLAFQGFVDRLHADLASRGFAPIGAADGYVVRALADQPLNQRELAQRLGITEQGAGKIAADMRRRKLILRRPDPRDSRAWQLALDRRGRALLKAARAFHARFEAELADQVGGDAAAMRRVLTHLVASSADGTARGRLRLA